MYVCMYVVECSRTRVLLLLYFVIGRMYCTCTGSKTLGRRQRKKPSLGLSSEFGGPPFWDEADEMSVWQKAGLNISRVTDFKQAWAFFRKQKKKKLVGLRFEMRLFEIESRITL